MKKRTRCLLDGVGGEELVGSSKGVDVEPTEESGKHSGSCLPLFREQRLSPQPGLTNPGLRLANFTLAEDCVHV